jgi:hypothetical protein
MDYRQHPHKLKARSAAFKERETNPDACKKSHYAIRRTIKKAKRQYTIKNPTTPALKLVGCGRATRELPSDASLTMS